MKNNNFHKIDGIAPGSIAMELGILPGDVLVSVNDVPVEDVFDYSFLTEDEYVELCIRDAAGEETVYEIEKDEDEDLGLIFENGLMDDYRSCSNKCIFCFIDQMPPGMRDTLYFKDDDSRLSFLQGNYVTLTNLSERDVDKIIRYRLEPINISVHTMDPELRCSMLHNRFAGDSLTKLDALYQGEIRMNGQIVLCKGINDGEHLRDTIEKLSEYLPFMESVSVVPVGLTRYREGLFPLEPFERADAEQVLDMVHSFQSAFMERSGTHFIHASDEWYLLAGRELPEEESYDGYLQLENGVGMLRLLMNESLEALENHDEIKADGIEDFSVATGVLAAPFIKEIIEKVGEHYPEIHYHLYTIKNEFFGEKITVAGLITGQDLIKQLGSTDTVTGRKPELGKRLLITENMLRAGETVFLDDVTVAELEEELGVRVQVIGGTGEDLVKGILGI